jgi:hypothetical protein
LSAVEQLVLLAGSLHVQLPAVLRRDRDHLSNGLESISSALWRGAV